MYFKEAEISTSKGGGRAFTFRGKSDSVETSGD
ncbi:unknown [Bacteroides sp. CAG:443]|nr:unknown [Bacteroides sp. CAG:443]